MGLIMHNGVPYGGNGGGGGSFSETVLYQTDIDTDAGIRQGDTITLSQPFTNFDEIIIEWGYVTGSYYEIFTNSYRKDYFSYVKDYKEAHPSTQIEINTNYYNGSMYTCFVPTANNTLYITAVGGGVKRNFTKIIGRKYNT